MRSIVYISTLYSAPLYREREIVYKLPQESGSYFGFAVILLAKTTAAQNEVALIYHRVCGLYFLAVIFAAPLQFLECSSLVFQGGWDCLMGGVAIQHLSLIICHSSYMYTTPLPPYRILILLHILNLTTFLSRAWSLIFFLRIIIISYHMLYRNK